MLSTLKTITTYVGDTKEWPVTIAYRSGGAVDITGHTLSWLVSATRDGDALLQSVLARVQAVAALGVDIEDWSFQGVTAAAEAAMGTGDALAILTAAVALRTAWDRLVYHTGDMRTADTLWPYLYDLATRGG